MSVRPLRRQEAEYLTQEIVSRSRSLDFFEAGAYLPDPDPILRKLGQDVRVYRELLADPHVFSCYQSRKSGTLCDNWEIEYPAAPGSKDPDQRIARLFEQVEALPFQRIIAQMLDAPFFGFAVLEIMWDFSSGFWVPREVVAKPNEWFAFDLENRLRFLSRDAPVEGELLPDRKFLLVQHHPTYENPYGFRLLSLCFWPVAFKKGGFKFWAIFAEKYGMPWTVGKVPRGTQANERSALLESLVKMVQDACAVINDDESVEIHEASGKAASAEVYEGLVRAANTEISKAILGQTLSTEILERGSYAAAQAHLEVREDLIKQDKALVAGAFNRLFRWIVDLNLGPDAPAPSFRFIEPEEIDKERAERDEILTRMGLTFSRSYIMRAYNLVEEDFDLLGQPPSGQATFAETRPRDPGQQAIDDMARRLPLGRVGAQMASKLANLVATSRDFEELLGSLYELHPYVDAVEFEELLRKASFAADLWGYLRAREEARALGVRARPTPHGEEVHLQESDQLVDRRDVPLAISVTMPPVSVNMPAVNVTTPPVNVNLDPPDVIVNAEAPQVRLEPVINVEPAEVRMDAPIVNIDPPDVHVTTPEVTVSVDARQATRKRVQFVRDAQGNIRAAELEEE